jgi:hypothetical protein
MTAAVPLLSLRASDQPQIRLMHQGGGLQVLAGLLLRNLPAATARCRPKGTVTRLPRDRRIRSG